MAKWYILGIDRGMFNDRILLMENLTESIVYAKRETATELILNEDVTNGCIDYDGSIQITWRKNCREPRVNVDGVWSLIGKIDDKYRIASSCGVVKIVTESTLKHLCKYEDVYNVAIKWDKLEYDDTENINIDKDTEFKSIIDKEYKNHISKSSLMGIDSRVGYIIRDNDVILTNYIGNGNSV